MWIFWSPKTKSLIKLLSFWEKKWIVWKMKKWRWIFSSKLLKPTKVTKVRSSTNKLKKKSWKFKLSFNSMKNDKKITSSASRVCKITHHLSMSLKILYNMKTIYSTVFYKKGSSWGKTLKQIKDCLLSSFSKKTLPPIQLSLNCLI